MIPLDLGSERRQNTRQPGPQYNRKRLALRGVVSTINLLCDPNYCHPVLIRTQRRFRLALGGVDSMINLLAWIGAFEKAGCVVGVWVASGCFKTIQRGGRRSPPPFWIVLKHPRCLGGLWSSPKPTTDPYQKRQSPLRVEKGLRQTQSNANLFDFKNPRGLRTAEPQGRRDPEPRTEPKPTYAGSWDKAEATGEGPRDTRTEKRRSNRGRRGRSRSKGIPLSRRG